ncbi:MAG TPA: trigger factor [Dehalococcoidia bacterium]|nr:trigger factor [Dehalococcoidia bacterium]
MKVTTQRLPESQVLLEIEVDSEQMEESMDKAYRKLVQRVEVPGFRKGKTPRAMLERHIGRERLLQEAIDMIVPDVYNQAIEEHDIDAIDQPQIEMTGADPLSFKATVPVRPTVDLGDYKKLHITREPAEVDPKDIDESIDELRRRYAVHEPVERAVQVGDIIRASVKITVDDREVYSDVDVELHLREGRTIMLPGFVEAITGATKGQELEIDLAIPEGEENGALAGKTAHVSAAIKEIKEEKLPDADDEFAQGVGEGFPTIADLRQRLTDDMQKRLDHEAEEKYHDEIVGELTRNATIEFPPIMIDREVERLIRDQARQTGQDVERYLELVKRTPQEIRDDLGPAATERVKRSLALGELANLEEIDITESDIDAEIDNIVAQAGGGDEEQTTRYRRIFDSVEAKASLGRSLLTKRTIDRLAEVVSADGASAKSAAKKKTIAKAETSTPKKSSSKKKTETTEEAS